jgi:RHS repeat-associated protein
MAETVLAMGSSGERTVRSYPLYDGHGNTVGQVARAEDDAPGGSFVAVPGAPAFELGARRKYDAWGQVRWSEGSPLDQGYCGSLQHRRDAESGLVYMRVRYYEPWTGRFLSEDPAMDGANWYVYCANDPVNLFDPDGLADHSTSGWYQFHMIMGMGYFSLAAILAVVDGWAGVYLSKVERLVKIGALILASYHLSAAVSETGRDEGSLATFLQGMEAYAGTIAMIGEAMGSSKARGFGMVAELAMAAYTLLLIGLLLRIDE